MRQKYSNLPAKIFKNCKNENLAAEGCPYGNTRPCFCMVKCIVFGTAVHNVSLFTVFPFPGERFCWYLRCSRSLEKDVVGIYGVPAPLRKILLVFTVFPLPGTRLCRFCKYEVESECFLCEEANQWHLANDAELWILAGVKTLFSSCPNTSAALWTLLQPNVSILHI